MANEILYAGQADQLTVEILSTEYMLLLASRDALDNHPALMYIGDVFGQGSKVIKLSSVGLMGYDRPVAGTEGSAASNTALADASYQVTVGWYPKVYEASDLARLVDRLGAISPEMLARDAIASKAVKMTDLIANVTDDFTTVQGTSGTNASWTDILDAAGTLNIANVPGPYMALLHPRQIQDIKNAIATATGTIQWLEASAAQMAVRGETFQGNLFGVDMFKSTLVPTANAGADRAGGMWGNGGVLWADCSVQATEPGQVVLGEQAIQVGQSVMRAGKVLFERDRNSAAGLTKFVSHFYVGVTKGDDARGVSIITDA